MKVLIIVAIFAVCSWAAPQGEAPTRPAVEIQTSVSNAHADGGYDFSYTLSDGTKRQEEGKIVNAGTDNETIAVTGSFSYPSPDGQVITLTYVSDVEGFKPQGEHLPKAPAVPTA